MSDPLLGTWLPRPRASIEDVDVVLRSLRDGMPIALDAHKFAVAQLQAVNFERLWTFPVAVGSAGGADEPCLTSLADAIDLTVMVGH